MIRYALYDRKNKKYDLFVANKEWLEKYRQRLVSLYDPKKCIWAKGTKYEKQYASSHNYYKRLEIVKFRCERV